MGDITIQVCDVKCGYEWIEINFFLVWSLKNLCCPSYNFFILSRKGCSKMSISLLSLLVGHDGPATMGLNLRSLLRSLFLLGLVICCAFYRIKWFLILHYCLCLCLLVCSRFYLPIFLWFYSMFYLRWLRHYLCLVLL